MAQPRKPSTKLLKLAGQALPKSRAQRSAAERRAVRLTRAWRQAHPNWNRQGGGGGGAAANPTRLLTPQQIGALADQLAQGDILPQQQAVEREQEQLAQQGAQQQALIGNLTQELGGLTAGIAPSIQTAYRQAANDQAAWAQGFSGGMEEIASAEAARNAAQLAQLGAPAEQIAQIEGQGEGAGNVLYGQGGYLPATSLGQQGAAFEAFGAQMPGIVARMGQQDVADAVANQAAAQKDLAGRAADIAAQLPSLRRQYVQTLLGNEMDKLSLRLAMQQLGLDTAKTGADIAYTEAQTLATINPDTGRPYGVDAAGNPIPEGPSLSEQRQRKKDKVAYREKIGKLMADTLKQAIEDNRPGGGGSSPVGIIGGGGGGGTTDAEIKKRLTYQKVFNRIYGTLAATYGAGNKKWRYGLTDAQVRALIKNFLIKQGVKPKPKPKPGPTIPHLSPPYPTPGAAVFPGSGLGGQ